MDNNPQGPAPYQHLLQEQQEQLQLFWTYQNEEISQLYDFKNHNILPLARIKKIMKADEDVRMISSEAPILFSKACELFILELTIRSWLHSQDNKRRTLHKNDIAAAITRTDIFDFLLDIFPREDIKDQANGMPYYYPPMGASSQARQSVWQNGDDPDHQGRSLDGQVETTSDCSLQRL